MPRHVAARFCIDLANGKMTKASRAEFDVSRQLSRANGTKEKGCDAGIQKAEVVSDIDIILGIEND
jgi:hypothetical protein